MGMFAYLNSVPDQKFILVFIVLIVVAHVASWAFDKWVAGGKR